MVSLPTAGDVSELCPEHIDTHFEDNVEFVGPYSSALFGIVTSVIESHTPIEDDY